MWTSYILAWLGALGYPALIGLGLWAFIAKRWRPGRWLYGLVLLIAPAWFLGVWAFLWEPETLVVRYVEVVSRTWRGPPLRIGIISDTHVVAPHMSAGRVRRIVARMNGERPDVVALLGDYVGGHAPVSQRSKGARDEVMAGLKALGGLKAPEGVYAILGNHDWWYDGPMIAAGLDAVGVHVLQNQGARVERPGGAFWVAGLSDFDSTAGRPSFSQAMLNAPANLPVIALSHRPDKFTVAPARAAVMLAGHTHCGQVNLPLIGRYLPKASEESRRWSCGLYEDHGRRLYVTAGLGVSFLPVRFRQPPEIAILTLRADPDAATQPAPAAQAPNASPAQTPEDSGAATPLQPR